MDYSKIGIFSLVKAKMDHSSQKHSVLSDNIANADTPGYTAQKIKEVNFKRMATDHSNRLKMRATDAQHLTGAAGGASGGTYRMEDRRKAFETTPTDNNVVIEEQIAEMAENKHEYEMATAIYKKTTQLFRTALGKNN